MLKIIPKAIPQTLPPETPAYLEQNNIISMAIILPKETPPIFIEANDQTPIHTVMHAQANSCWSKVQMLLDSANNKHVRAKK